MEDLGSHFGSDTAVEAAGMQKAGPRPKRRKIQLACNKCRTRKTKCDGRRPVCIACEERDLAAECTYYSSSLNSQMYISELKGRPERLWRAEISDGAENTDGLDRYSNPVADNSPDRTGGPGTTSQKQTSVGIRVTTTTPVSSHDSHSSIRVDGLATVASPDENEHVYGESSTIAFVRHVSHDQWMHTQQQYHPPPLESVRERDEGAAVYPRRQTADDFIFSFWEFVHPIFPVLHKGSFMSRYDKLWSSNTNGGPNDTVTEIDEVIFSSTLNMLFALGSQFSRLVPAKKRVAVAEEFYQRSRKLFIYDVLDAVSIPTVQLFLITGVYLQSTRYADRCWNIVGLAIRAAQNIGLHSESANRRDENQLDREMRRRVWYTCLTLDRLLSMTFGRPTMITRSWDIPAPVMIDDEFLRTDAEGAQPSNVASRMGLFVYSSKLYDILHDILSTFYTEREMSKQGPMEASSERLIVNILAFNRQLDNFHDSIPEYLQPQPTPDQSALSQKSNHIRLQVHVLQCRFLYTRVLLLRPLLLLNTKKDPGASTPQPTIPNTATLDRELVNHACNLCARTAQGLVENLFHNLDTPYRITAWHTVYLTFAAAIVLIAAQKCPAVDALSKQESLTQSLTRCISILEYHEQQINSAGQAIQVLQRLRSQSVGLQGHGVQYRAANNENTDIPTAPVVENKRMMMGTLAHVESSQDWMNEFMPNRTDSNSEAWFSQHLASLDWLEVPSFPEN